MGTWRERKLGQLFQIKHGYAFKGEFFSDSGPFVVLTPGNFFEEGGFRHKGEKEKYYTGEVPNGYVLKRGDLLVAMTEQAEGLLGSSAIVPESDCYLHNQRLGLITDVWSDEIDKIYLYYLFNTRGVRNQIRASASGTKVRHTSPARIYEVEVRIPDIGTQQKIVDILSAYDDLIENNTRRIAILEEMARALYREWFVDFRFPGHEGVRMVESEVGPIPEGWEVTTIGDVAEMNARSIRAGNAPEDIHYVDIASVSPGRIDKIDQVRFEDAPSRARRIVQHGDTIWSMVRPNRRSYSIVLDPVPNMIVSTGFAVLTPTEVPFSYLYHATTTDQFAGYLANRATGAAYPAVNGNDFAMAQVLLPPSDLLDRFQEATGPMLELRSSLQTKNASLRCTRDLLLPKLVSGEIDVSEMVRHTAENAA